MPKYRHKEVDLPKVNKLIAFQEKWHSSRETNVVNLAITYCNLCKEWLEINTHVRSQANKMDELDPSLFKDKFEFVGISEILTECSQSLAGNI